MLKKISLFALALSWVSQASAQKMTAAQFDAIAEMTPTNAAILAAQVSTDDIATALSTLRTTNLGQSSFDTFHTTATGVDAALTTSIGTVAAGTVADDVNTIMRQTLKILYRWSQGSGGITHGGGNLNVGAATENNVTLHTIVNALVARTLA